MERYEAVLSGEPRGGGESSDPGPVHKQEQKRIQYENSASDNCNLVSVNYENISHFTESGGTSSSRKRPHEEESDKSDVNDSDTDAKSFCNSSSWEDQESSDDNKLKIDVPKKKVLKKRHKSPSRRANKEIAIPEDVLAECSKLLVMDQKLDAKAKSINWGTKQVKMVLRAIVQSEEMMIMLRNAGLATGEKQPQQEPKMTRAMTKKVVEAGGEVPFIVPQATPVKDVHKDLAWLFSEDLNEEDNDPEYNPEADTNLSDDDESLLTSEPSEAGTPCTQNTDSRMSFNSAMSTPTSGYRPTPDKFKRPFRSLVGGKLNASRTLDFDSDVAMREGRVYSTRSRVSISHNIEELEQQFVPPDITPDMYDAPNENGDEDYLEFLKELYGGNDKINNVSPPDDNEMEGDDDPEFVYCQDEAEEEIKDPEEHRNDKATKITKKEVANLMNELLEYGNQNINDDNKKKMYRERKDSTPSDAIFDAVKEQTERVIKPPKQSSSAATDVPAVEEIAVLSPEEREELGRQMQQHIQLLTQMSLLSSHSAHWAGVRAQCDSMMSEILSLSLMSGPSMSVAAQPNLLTSMATIQQWDKEGCDPTNVIKNKNSTKNKKRYREFHIDQKLVEFMSRQSVFYYPKLLPSRALNQDDLRIMWTEAEDNLLTFAMKESVSLAKKPTLVELSFALQKRYMKAKTAYQVLARIKNLKLREGDNPVTKFINTGEFSPQKIDYTRQEVGNGGRVLVEMFVSGSRKDFSNFWQKNLSDIIMKGSKRPLPISPRPKTRHKPPLIMSCAAEIGHVSPVQRHQPPILCVDGNNVTPVSDSDTSALEPASNTNSEPESTNRSPIKKLILSTAHFNKSPLKVASDRIIKKYTAISPHKRTGSSLLKSPLKKSFRRKPLTLSPKPVTPSRKMLKRIRTPPNLDHNFSPRFPSIPSPSLDDGDGTSEVDTPTNIGKRKSKVQKENELTLALVGPLETPGEKDARVTREISDIFNEIMKIVNNNKDKKDRFGEIMARASTEGTVKTYKDLSLLVEGHDGVQEILLDLLSDSQAAEAGREIYCLHQQRQNMKKFILKLGVAFKHQPAYHARVLRELDSLCSEPGLGPDTLRAAALKLFRHNQHLLDTFMMLTPGVEPPESLLPSPENIEFSDTDSDISGPTSETENLVLPKSPEPRK